MSLPTRVENHSDEFDFDVGELCGGASHWEADRFTIATRDHSAEEITREQARELIAKLSAWIDAGSA